MPRPYNAPSISIPYFIYFRSNLNELERRVPFEAEDAAVRQDLCLPRCEGRACQGKRAEIRRPARRLAAESAQERVAAKAVLAELLLRDLRENPAVPYEQDEVTRLILDGLNLPIYREYQDMTIGELRERILSAPPEELTRMGRGLSSEVIAAVCKLMSNLDLIYAAARMRVKATCVTTIGEPGTLSARLQPNHPVDDVEGITASVLEGLSFGMGDAVIGLNPVDASTASVQAILTRFDELKRRYEIPTQICVLAHVTTQMEAVRNGAPCDLMFQSIAGSEKGNAAFGISAD